MHAPTGVEDISQVGQHIADDDAAQHTVEAEQEEGHDGGEHTVDREFRMSGAVCLHSRLSGLPAQRDLRQHQRVARNDGEDDVNKQESKSSVGSHLIREAPDVPKTDRRSYGSHQETKVGLEISFV